MHRADLSLKNKNGETPMERLSYFKDNGGKDEENSIAKHHRKASVEEAISLGLKLLKNGKNICKFPPFKLRKKTRSEMEDVIAYGGYDEKRARRAIYDSIIFHRCYSSYDLLRD